MTDEGLQTIQEIHEFFTRQRSTLSVAESCTGGYISHLITILPGASRFFTAGVVAYSADAKESILGVSPECIAEYGMVSEQTARQMAEGIRELTGSDYSLSTTGNLGPGVLEGKTRGLIFIAVSSNGKTVSKSLRLKGARGKVKEEASRAALQFLLDTAGKISGERKKSSS